MKNNFFRYFIEGMLSCYQFIPSKITSTKQLEMQYFWYKVLSLIDYVYQKISKNI